LGFCCAWKTLFEIRLPVTFFDWNISAELLHNHTVLTADAFFNVYAITIDNNFRAIGLSKILNDG